MLKVHVVVDQALRQIDSDNVKCPGREPLNNGQTSRISPNEQCQSTETLVDIYAQCGARRVIQKN